MSNDKLQKFTELALSIESPNLLPWAGITSSEDVLHQLKSQVIVFARGYINKATSPDGIEQSADTLEAMLRTEEVVSPATRDKVNLLLDMLEELVNDRLDSNKS